MASSPFGRFSDVAASAAGLLVLGAWLLAQLNVGGTLPTPALDNAAVLVLGVLLGQRATTNGAGKIAAAAHRRLDAINAPPADTGAPG